MSKEKDQLTVVVNGVSVEVTRNSHAALQSVIGKALEETNNVGQPMQNWELRDAGGNILDPGSKIGDLPPGAKLFLSLKAGVGG